MKKQVNPPLITRFRRSLLLAAIAALGLSACERNQPTPDPAPAPPAPRTLFHHVAPSVHYAVFTYPATGTSFMQQNPAATKRNSLIQA